MTPDAEFSITPVQRPSQQDNPASAEELLKGKPGLRLHIQEAALSGIRRHAGDDESEEVGGILLGRHYQTETDFLVVVSDHLAVQSDSRSAVHFEFDKKAISMIAARLEGSAEYVVGWYHSHTTGRPFMSSIDYENHRTHFPAPWFVSCVVGSGEWGLPVDFWRFADDEFSNISDYSIDVMSDDDATDAHQEFLKACQMAESSPPMSPEYAEILTDELGLGSDGAAISSIFSAMTDNQISATSLDEFRLVVELASKLAADPETASGIAVLLDQLPLMRSYEGRLVPLLISDQFRNEFAFSRWRGLSISSSSTVIWWPDLRLGRYYPVHLDLPVLAGSISANGVAWLLVSDGSVVRLASSARAADEEGAPAFRTVTYTVPKLRGEPQQVVAEDSSLWILTSEHCYQLALGTDIERAEVRHVLDLPTADTRLLLDGFIGPLSSSRLLTQRGRTLQSWGADDTGLRMIAEQALPATWPDWPLTHACRGSLGLYLLFGREEHGQLGLFDEQSLTPVRRYVNDVAATGVSSPTGVHADPFGRVFLRCDRVLCRLRP